MPMITFPCQVLGYPAKRKVSVMLPWSAWFALAVPVVAHPQVQPMAQALPAAPASAQVAPAKPTFAIGGFDVKGENPLPPSETSTLLAPYLRTQATIDTLAAASAALEAGLKARGYGLYKVVLPPQELGATVTLEIVKFTINKVEVKGNQHVDSANILASLPELSPGRSPNLQLLSRQAGIANNSAYKQVRVGLKESTTPDMIDATIEVQDVSPLMFGVDISNAGTKATGYDRIILLAGHGNLFNRDHSLSAAWTTSATRPEDVNQWGLAYRIPLYSLGASVWAAVSQSDVVGRFGAFNSTGAGETVQLGYTQQLPAAGNRTSEWSASLADRLFKGAQLEDASGVPIEGSATPDTRSRSLNLGYGAAIRGERHTIYYNLILALSLPGGSGNNLAAYSNNGLNPAITSASWQALRGSASYQKVLTEDWLLAARTEFQYSNDALIAGEQFGLGGAGSLRGMAERALQADKGIGATVEVLSPELAPRLRAIAFVDAGWLGNNNPNPTRISSDSALGTGVGLRWSSEKHFTLRLDYGRLLVGSRLPAASYPDAPRQGDQCVYGNLSMRY